MSQAELETPLDAASSMIATDHNSSESHSQGDDAALTPCTDQQSSNQFVPKVEPCKGFAPIKSVTDTGESGFDDADSAAIDDESFAMKVEVLESEMGDGPAEPATHASELEAADDASEENEIEQSENGFHALGLSDPLTEIVERLGYTKPTPIQEHTISHILQGRDVLGQAQTGTGKTAAFALPILDRIDLKKKRPQVLVLTPTRELAIQVADSFEKYAAKMKGFRVVPIYGGQDYEVQLRQFKRGVQVVVGTPGRVMDHMRRGTLKLDDMHCLVLDEADEMLRMGFAEDVDWVLSEAPEKRQMALFSATMPGPIRQIAQKHLNDPAEITIKQKTATADTVHQRYVVVTPRQKQAALARILEAESTDGVLVFVKMRSTTEPLAEHLARQGLKTAALNGDVAQSKRERIVESLRSGKIDVIIATDVAARGLDVQRISHVVNYDLPHDSEAYVHRIGRTGRAGRKGEAILFVHPKEQRQLKRLEHATRQPIEPMGLPSNRTINKRRIARFHEKMKASLDHKEIETFRSIVEQFQTENEEIPIEMIAASLAVMANQDVPLLLRETLDQVDFDKNSRNDSRSRGRDSGNRRSRDNRDSGAMETYRIEVGRKNSVQPGNIVGAIANESGISSSSIGRIKIFDWYSTVDLPEGISNNVLNTLKNVFVAGRRLQISRMDDSRPRFRKKDNHKFKGSDGFKSKQKRRKKPNPR